MPNDATTHDRMDAKKGSGKERPKKKAIDNPLFVPTVSEEAEGEAVKNNGAQENAAVGKRAEAARATAPALDAKVRDLEKQNAALLVRIRQLELERVKRETEEAMERLDDLQDASEESKSIIQIVVSLERQLDDSFALRDSLETDLETTRTKLSNEMVARRGLEERVRLLEAEAALVEPLRDELSFVEQERNEIARNFKTTADTLERTTKERNAFAEKLATVENRVGELEGVRADLEGQGLNLEERVHELSHVRKELEERNAQCHELMQQLRDITGQLEAAGTSQKALELDLATNKKARAELQEEIKVLNQKVAHMEAESVDLREQIEERQVENVDLRAQNNRLEQELKSRIAKHTATTAELEASRKALRDVRSAASRMEKRVQKRYIGLSTKTNKEEKPPRTKE